MKKLEDELKKKEGELKNKTATGHINVNGPLPPDFNDVFAKSVAKATGCDPTAVRVVETKEVVNPTASFMQTAQIVKVTFQAPGAVVKEVEKQAADPNSALTTGALEQFLVAKDEVAVADQGKPTPVKEKGIDIDTDMPYGELEPFGREDTAQELTEQSIHESDEMVDQMERAEVAEEKRAVFRALTRLRGAAITSYDGVARAQTGNIDEYNKINKWRKAHPLHHLAAEESDISKWAFPDNADF
eukprot:GEMP01030901.1.p1 GENE.GEMP01030901.1~~GEMP01030901.1.p1  ORF type:complete len:244 (+),score=86.72 GEMP01030901.1:918-1649(+)